MTIVFMLFSFRYRFPTAESANASPPRVRLSNNGGFVEGTRGKSGSDARYLGIPYAKPPIGEDGRWKKPMPLDAYDDDTYVRAMESGRPCFGRVVPGTEAALMSEDCLTLDIYTPSRQAADLQPVLVYFHGGSLVEGSSSAIQSAYMSTAIESPVRTFEDEAIVVSVNYRVSVLGFLALEVLGENQGNYGLYDCIESLRWIRKHIQDFGGDPNRVSIFGQSSGGSLVLALAGSPLAAAPTSAKSTRSSSNDSRLLFQRGISMSGSPKMDTTWKEVSTTWHPEFLSNTPCDENEADASLRECLYNMSGKALQDAMPSDWDSASFSFGAFSDDFKYAPLLLIDGKDGSLPSDYLSIYSSPPPGSPLADPNFVLVIGATREEIDFAPGDDVSNMTAVDFAEFVRSHISAGLGEDVAEMAVERYGLSAGGAPPPQQQQVYAQIVTDATIWCPTLHLANAAVAGDARATIYLYQTDQQPGHPYCPLRPFQAIENYCPKYAFHAVDLFFLFAPHWGAPRCCPGDENVSYAYTRNDVSYGELVSRRFLEIAANGSSPAWVPYDIERRSVVRLSSPGEARVSGLREKFCRDLWWPLYDRLGLIN